MDTKLIVAFRNFAKAPKKAAIYRDIKTNNKDKFYIKLFSI